MSLTTRLIAPGLIMAIVTGLFCAITSPPARAGEALVAVAANFTETARALQAGFEAETGHRLELTPGSTGRFYAQIANGAPFDVFLAADQATPERLASEGFALEGSRFTYAEGRIALWSANTEGGPVETRLREGRYRHFAIANPALAPYGAAAREALQSIGLWDEVQDHLVTGASIAQVHSMIETGNADLGVVAVSHFAGSGMTGADNWWEIPSGHYAAIRQDAILTRHGETNAAAISWLDYLQSPAARAIIRAHGYGVDG